MKKIKLILDNIETIVVNAKKRRIEKGTIWFNNYVEMVGKKKEWKTFKGRYLCPCCKMPTLEERAGFDICCICFWEDDGQDSDDADVIRGGPNGSYSLIEASINFQEHLTMYSEEDVIMFNIQEKTKERRVKLITLFQKALENNSDEDYFNALVAEEEYKDWLDSRE